MLTYQYVWLYRQKRPALPRDLAMLADFQCSGEWATTGGPQPQQFLVHDSGVTAQEWILVFAAPEQLRHLAVADKWYMDGSFAIAPRLFQQLYVIRAALGNSAVTCAYAFLPGEHAM